MTDVVFSPDGEFFLTTSTDADGRVWEVPSGSAARLFAGSSACLATAAFSPNGRWIVTAGPKTPRSGGRHGNAASICAATKEQLTDD